MCNHASTCSGDYHILWLHFLPQPTVTGPASAAEGQAKRYHHDRQFSLGEKHPCQRLLCQGKGSRR